MYTKHTAGSYDNDTKLQLCTICGCVLLDYNGAHWLDEEFTPAGFNEGSDVFVSPSGSFKTREISPETEFKDCTSNRESLN